MKFFALIIATVMVTVNAGKYGKAACLTEAKRVFHAMDEPSYWGGKTQKPDGVINYVEAIRWYFSKRLLPAFKHGKKVCYAKKELSKADKNECYLTKWHKNRGIYLRM